MSNNLRFIIEKGREGLVHITSSFSEKNPYADLPEFFQWKSKNRCDNEWESLKGGDGRFYIHSAINESEELRILILYNRNRVGNKEVLSEKLEDECLKLLNKDYSNLEWWFELEQLCYDRQPEWVKEL